MYMYIDCAVVYVIGALIVPAFSLTLSLRHCVYESTELSELSGPLCTMYMHTNSVDLSSGSPFEQCFDLLIFNG